MALKKLGGDNPFSPDRVRERRELTFPEIDRHSLTRPERKIYDRSREHAVAIGLTGLKGAFAVAETEALEDFVSARFHRTSSRMQQRLMLAHRAAAGNEDFQALHTVFAIEGAKRMGVAMVAIADASEQAMLKLVERPLIEEDVSLLRLLFGGRRR